MSQVESQAEPVELTVEELHANLGKLLELRPETADWRVMIPYSRGTPALGGRTATPATRMDVGFDHERRKVYLVPTDRLGLNDEKLQELGKRASDQAGLLTMLEMTLNRIPADSAEHALAHRLLEMIYNRPGGLRRRSAQGVAK